MLYPTLNQPFVVFVLIISGALSALTIEILSILSFLSGKDKFTKNLFDFFKSIIFFAIVFFTNLIYNFGQFRIYVILVYFASFVLFQFLLKLLWTKCIKKCYNNFIERWKTKRKKS